MCGVQRRVTTQRTGENANIRQHIADSIHADSIHADSIHAVIISGMALFSTVSESGELQARVAEELLSMRGIAYAQLSPQLDIVEISPSFYALLQETVPPVEGKAIAEVCWEFFGLEATLEKILQGELADFYLPDINRTQLDGTVRYYDFSVMPLHIQRPGRGLLLIVEDVTREGELDQALVQDRNRLRLLQDQLARANEELKRLNQLKSVFLSMAAHDLRTPLTAIQGYVELGISSLESGEGEDLKDFMPAIQTQIDRLQHLIGDFLDLNMIEQGKLSIYPMPCMLADVVWDVVKLMGEYVKRQGLRLNVDLAGSVQVLADPSRLRQVLYNLLGNAVKYGASGGEIYIQTWADDQFGYMQVKDCGPGIAPEALPNLFQLYYRAGVPPGDDSIHSPIRGTGVGLYIVKFLVESQRGSVQVKSEIGKGSAFTVSLPLARLP